MVIGPGKHWIELQWSAARSLRGVRGTTGLGTNLGTRPLSWATSGLLTDNPFIACVIDGLNLDDDVG